MSDAIQELTELAAKAAVCVDCGLSASRKNVVFGDGDPKADLMFVGEGPGRHEDEQGLPFVGPSGKLLEQLLAEIGLLRSEVYIGNVVKCRPPNNRDPRPDEIEACKPYLRRQLELIQPKVVVTLGNFSTKLLLKTETGITRLRGSAYPWWGRQLVPTFHPAAALRGGAARLDEMRHDFEIVRDILEAPPERPGGSSFSAEEPAEDEPQVEQLDLFA